MANMMQMMQKAQKMKARMEDLQSRAAETVVTGEAGGGLVSCRMTGRFEVEKITLSPEALAEGDVSLLEDMIVAAIADARARADRHMAEETEKIMKDLGLPPGLGLPF